MIGPLAFAFLSFGNILFSLPTVMGSYQNVYGQPLQPCSTDGMALTGFTRTGYCVEQSDDTGSHHICINLSSTNGGNFCDVTGQSDWCSSEMPCVDNPNDNCLVQDWCVCQWAFASYLQNAGGCDQIQDIQCDAINLEAVIAYQATARQQEKYADALQCLVERCGLDSTTDFAALQSSRISAATTTNILWVTSVCLGIGAAVYYYKRQKDHRERAMGQTLLSQSPDAKCAEKNETAMA